jgi:hypothetical protein
MNVGVVMMDEMCTYPWCTQQNVTDGFVPLWEEAGASRVLCHYYLGRIFFHRYRCGCCTVVTAAVPFPPSLFSLHTRVRGRVIGGGSRQFLQFESMPGASNVRKRPSRRAESGKASMSLRHQRKPGLRPASPSLGR